MLSLLAMITQAVLLYHYSFIWFCVCLLRTAPSLPLVLYIAEAFYYWADYCDQGQSVNTECQRILNEGVCKSGKGILLFLINTLLALKCLHWLLIPLVNSLNDKVIGIFLLTCNYFSSLESDPVSVQYKIFSLFASQSPYYHYHI